MSEGIDDLGSLTDGEPVEHRAKESWLSSKSHERFAAAVVACQSGAPWECVEAGACAHAGSCFTTDRQAASRAWQMINRLHSDNDEVQRHLSRAVAFLRYGKTA